MSLAISDHGIHGQRWWHFESSNKITLQLHVNFTLYIVHYMLFIFVYWSLKMFRPHFLMLQASIGSEGWISSFARIFRRILESCDHQREPLEMSRIPPLVFSINEECTPFLAI